MKLLILRYNLTIHPWRWPLRWPVRWFGVSQFVTKKHFTSKQWWVSFGFCVADFSNLLQLCDVRYGVTCSKLMTVWVLGVKKGYSLQINTACMMGAKNEYNRERETTNWKETVTIIFWQHPQYPCGEDKPNCSHTLTSVQYCYCTKYCYHQHDNDIVFVIFVGQAAAVASVV